MVGSKKVDIHLSLSLAGLVCGCLFFVAGENGGFLDDKQYQDSPGFLSFCKLEKLQLYFCDVTLLRALESASQIARCFDYFPPKKIRWCSHRLRNRRGRWDQASFGWYSSLMGGSGEKKGNGLFSPFFHQVKLNAVHPAKQKPNTVSLQQKQTEGCAPTQQQQTGPGSLAQPKPDRIPLPSFNKHTPNQQKQTEGRFLFQQKQTKTNKTN